MALAACVGREQDGHTQIGGPMGISSSPQPPPSPALLRFLRHELGLSDNALQLGLKQSDQEQAPLPVVLWRFGLITLEQFDQVLSWQAALDP